MIDNNNDNNDNNDNDKCSKKITINNAIDSFGWLGSALILSSYLGNLDSTTDIIVNSCGSLFLFVVCVKQKAFQPACLNAVWFGGGLYNYFKPI